MNPATLILFTIVASHSCTATILWSDFFATKALKHEEAQRKASCNSEPLCLCGNKSSVNIQWYKSATQRCWRMNKCRLQKN